MNALKAALIMTVTIKKAQKLVFHNTPCSKTMQASHQYLLEVAEATLPCVATPAIAAFTLPASVVAVLGFEATKEDVRCLLELLLPALFIAPRT